MKVTGEGGTFPEARKNQRMYQAFSLVHYTKNYVNSNPIMMEGLKWNTGNCYSMV